MASQQQLKTPPLLENEEHYSEWRCDLQIWLLFTDLSVAKQGPAVYLSLSGRARDCVRELTSEQIGHDDGVKTILAKLDKVFLKDDNTRAYLAFKEFYDYKRASGVNITEFLVQFEYLYHKLGKFDVKLPEGVQAFFLLNAANVSEENERLARATCSVMNYENMKTTIKKFFGDPAAVGGGNGAPSVKAEPVFVSEHESALQTRGWQPRGRGRGRGRGYRNYNYGRDSNDTNYRRSNPVGRDGKTMKCFKCNSTEHFSRYCDKGQGSSEKVQEIHITLLNADQQMSMLVHESLGMGVLDSACTKTVTGETWLNAFIDTMTDKDKSLVEYSSSDTKFKFGDGVEVIANKKVKFPVLIGRKKLSIESCVVNNEIPLLLSKESMKKARVVLNFKDDTATVLDDTVDLICTSSGHYCIPLTNMLLNEKAQIKTSIVLHTSAISSLTKKEKRIKAIKLHKQFCHASKEKLCKLVRESKDFRDEEFLTLIKECVDSCELCLKYKRPPLRPVVGMPLADRFNQVVCMDLKEYVHNELWIFHLIDAATRYSAACLIRTKNQDEIVRNIYQIWIAYFGAPKQFLSDNGGEFSNEKYREMNEKLNIETLTTAAESPFSNGVVERHNQILAEAFHKTLDDEKCDPKVALAWAVSAKNSLQNQEGFSPNQLVFGFNPNYPSVLHDKLPALENSSKDIIRQTTNAIHSARRNYIAAESSERIRRALRHNVRTYSDTVYINGDRVYYRRKDYKGWKGPAVVMGADGQFVLIRHGGAYYRVHPCQLMKINDNGGKIQNEQKNVKGVQSNNKERYQVRIMDEDEDKSKETIPEIEIPDNDIHEEDVTEVSDTEEIQEESVIQDTRTEDFQKDKVQEGRGVSSKVDKPGINSYVSFKLNDVWNQAKVLSMQPKKSGTLKNWINVHVDGEEKPISVNWDDVQEWSELSECENTVLLTSDQEMSQDVVDAKDEELESLEENDVFEVVPFINQPTISSRWVITEKLKKGKKKKRAQLVVRGYEENTSKLRKDSPTCGRECLLLVFITAVLMSWKIQSIDITAAFLQGGLLEREVYLRPPRDVCPKENVWRLKRCIYGLNDAPRSWYNRVKEFLVQLGGQISIYDNALFLWHDKFGQLIGMLVSHVDDFAFCGNEVFIEQVILKLLKSFKISKHEIGAFKYLGLEVLQTAEGIQVHQDFYIPSIAPIELAENRKERKNDELTTDEKSELKRLSGQMMWVASHTRPDVSFETCSMSNTGKHPTIKMIHEANKAITKLKSKKVSLKFPKLGKPENLKILAFSDATYASLEDGSSQGGQILLIQGENNKVVPISWRSKKLDRVTKSPLASETLALSEAADSGFLMSSLIQEIFGLSVLPPVHCFTDNESLTRALGTSNLISDRRLRVDIARLREMVSKKEIDVFWIDGKAQLADSLTKRGASTLRLLDVLSTNTL